MYNNYNIKIRFSNTSADKDHCKSMKSVTSTWSDPVPDSDTDHDQLDESCIEIGEKRVRNSEMRKQKNQ